jgi:hypothetical protein
MATNIAAEIEKEFGEVTFIDPSIQFDFNKIRIQQKLNVIGKGYLIFWTLAPVLLFIVFPHSVRLLFFVPLMLVVLAFLYQYHRCWDVITIDFTERKISIRNKFFPINFARKFFSARTTLPFDKIAYFSTDDGKKFYYFSERNSLTMARTMLYVKPAFKQDVALASFRFEKDAKRLGELFQYYIVGKAVQLTSLSNV